jgi:hypothetical protein
MHIHTYHVYHGNPTQYMSLYYNVFLFFNTCYYRITLALIVCVMHQVAQSRQISPRSFFRVKCYRYGCIRVSGKSATIEHLD